MSSSAIFTGAGFYVAGASQYTPGTVRVTYSSAPKASNPAGVDDALNPANYVLSGPGPVSMVGVAAVSGDPLSFDILLATPLAIGTWTVTVSNVKTPALDTLSAPTAAVFQVTSTAAVTPLSAGAENDDAERIIRKHLSQALRGDNWDAVIKALSVGDDRNWDNARAAFDQLFVSSASGSWLEARASDEGISKPLNVGISDDLFRDLVIKTSANKVVHEAIREILEVFYGQDSLRAFVESAVDENYNLTGGISLSWTLDEKQSFTHTFQPEEFSSVTTAKALEVALALTKTMRDLGSKGFAVPYRSPETGLNRFRIYSGSLGLGSFVRVTGGEAQNIFKFPTEVDVYSGTISIGTGYTWSYTRPDQDTTRVSLTINTGLSTPLIDLSGVQEGDYVIIGADAQTGSTGTYSIKAVSISWSGALLTQSFDIERLDFNSTAVQASNSAYSFYRPTKSSISAAAGRTVVVAQTQAGQVDISIPATTQAVNRGPGTGAYARSNEVLDIVRLQRLPSGTVTVQTLTPHTLSVDGQVLLDGIVGASSRPFITPGNDAAYPSSYEYPASHLQLVAETQAPSTATTENGVGIRLSNGQILFAGGYRTVASAYDGAKTFCNRYVQGSTATIIDGTEADGATRHSHTWASTSALNVAREYHSGSTYGSGALVTGGLTLSPYTILSSAEQYTVGGSWTTIAALATGRSGHGQVELDNGTVMVIGGAITEGTATVTTEIYNGTSWSAGAPLVRARTDFRAVKLSDGRVLVSGGRLLGRGHDSDADTLALWRLDEASGTAVSDATSTYPLTANGAVPVDAVAISAQGKINNCRDFDVVGAYLTGAGSGAAVTALLDEWTLELWFKRTTVAAGQFISYGGATEVAADNLLMNVGIDGSGRVFWKWETGAGIDVTQTMTTALTGLAAYREGFFNHLAVRKQYNGSNYDVSVFINGILYQTWTGQANASDGASGVWYVARNPEVVGSYFPGRLDDIRVSKVARTDAEILANFHQGWGNHQSPSGEIAIGAVTAECEIYDGATWARTGQMAQARCFHQAILLPGDEVLVIGGLGYRPSLLGTLTGDDVALWPSTDLNTAEVWNPTTGRWRTIRSAGVRRHRHLASYLEAVGKVAVLGGESSVGDDTSAVEFLDIATQTWARGPSDLILDGHSVFGDVTSDGTEIVVMGGNDGTITHPRAQASIYGGLQVSSGGLNGQHRIVAVPTATSFQVETLQVPEHSNYTSIFGADYQGQTHSEGFWTIATGARASNVTTLTFSLPSGISAHGIVAGDSVYVNSRTAPFSSGLVTVTAATDTTISYADVGANQGSIAVVGSVSENQALEAVATAAEALPQAVNDPGPYIFDPVDSVSVTATEASTVIEDIYANQQQESVEVDTGDDFPDEGGYIVFGYGTEKQSKPVKYLGKFKSGPTNTKLILDYSLRFTEDYPVGTKVTLLSQRGAFVPEDPLIGTTWITASSAGRVAAQASAEAALAAGVVADVTIVYPGDRGLGGEGLPASGTEKLSDRVAVFAGDDVSEEVQAAREE